MQVGSSAAGAPQIQLLLAWLPDVVKLNKRFILPL